MYTGGGSVCPIAVAEHRAAGTTSADNRNGNTLTNPEANRHFRTAEEPLSIRDGQTEMDGKT